MRLDDFDYQLPAELIAQEPLPQRDASRLFVVDRNQGSFAHHMVRDLPRMLRPGDLLVVNDARVIPARIFGTRDGAQVELLLVRETDGPPGRTTFEALAKPARKFLPGSTIRVGESRVPLEVLEVLDAKRRRVAFPDRFDVPSFLEREGHVPLPPYIRREDTPLDHERYQTVFARNPGAVAAPTAGLHFTPGLIDALREAGVALASLTLDVGPGTFVPVLEPDPRRHHMERERFAIPAETAEAVAAVREKQGRVVAVGTTVVRALESAAEPSSRGLRPGEGWTDLFILPPYPFRVVDALLTNFHLPRSTLFMLVGAFGGTELVRRAYREAVERRYRFYSYGDAMLLQ